VPLFDPFFEEGKKKSSSPATSKKGFTTKYEGGKGLWNGVEEGVDRLFLPTTQPWEEVVKRSLWVVMPNQWILDAPLHRQRWYEGWIPLSLNEISFSFGLNHQREVS